MKYLFKAFLLILILFGIAFIVFYNNSPKLSKKKNDNKSGNTFVKMENIIKNFKSKPKKISKPDSNKKVVTNTEPTQKNKQKNKPKLKNNTQEVKNTATKNKFTSQTQSFVKINLSDRKIYKQIANSINAERKDKKLKFSVSWEIESNNGREIYTKYFFMIPVAKVNKKYYSLNSDEVFTEKDLSQWPIIIVSDRTGEWKDILDSKGLNNVNEIYYLGGDRTASTFFTKINQACKCLEEKGLINKNSKQQVIIRGKVFGVEYNNYRIATYLPTIAIINGEEHTISMDCFKGSEDIEILKKLGYLN